MIHLTSFDVGGLDVDLTVSVSEFTYLLFIPLKYCLLASVKMIPFNKLKFS